MAQDFSQFLALMQPQPGYKILEVTSHADALTRALAELLKPYRGRLSLALYPGDHGPIEASERVKPHSIVSYKLPFRALPRDNDIVILSDVLQHHAFPERLLQIAYRTLANAGEVIIVSKEGSVDVEEQLRLLEACEFRAANRIELLEGYEVVMAKKMHMWGNGL
jgi:hypothetical protein